MPPTPFEQEVADLRPFLMKFARLQLRNEAWAEDAVSETLLAALAKPQAFE
nr:RNA polymerase subunit sigma [Hydrogenophaga sp.]